MKIYIAKSEYLDQYSDCTAVIGVFTDLKLALECRDWGAGYVRIYLVEPNTRPMKIIEEVKE